MTPPKTWIPDARPCPVPDDRRCRGTVKNGVDKGRRCRKPSWPAPVCRTHGGAAPQVIAMAERRRAHAAATEAVEALGLPRNIDPHAALLEEVHRTAGHVTWLGELIQSLERADLKQYTHDEDGRQWERPSVWYELYKTERAHLVQVCAKAIAAGVAERQVRLAEEQGTLIVKLLRGVLDDLGLGDDRHAREVVARHLRSIDGGAAA